MASERVLVWLIVMDKPNRDHYDYDTLPSQIPDKRVTCARNCYLFSHIVSQLKLLGASVGGSTLPQVLR